MKIRFILFGVLFCLSAIVSKAQTGKLTGTVINKDNPKDVIVGAQVKLFMNSERKASANTDEDGNFAFSALDPGEYSLEIKYIGFSTYQLTGIRIEGGRTLSLPIGLSVPDSNKQIGVVTVVAWRGKQVDQTTTGENYTGEDFKNTTLRGINGLVSVTGGVQTTDGGDISVKGDRPGGSKYIVDGIPVGSGAANLPKSSIASIDVITGGIPAEFGDLTGGIISVTTKGPSAYFSGGLEGLSSQYIDPFGYNLIEGSLTGPIVKKKNDPGSALLGFAISGNYTHVDVSNPPAIDLYRVKDDVLASIKSNPVRQSATGTGYVSNAAYVTLDQMQKTRVEANTKSGSYNFSGKLDFQPTENVDIVIGGNLDHTDRNAFIYSFAMFNADNNPEVIDNNYRGFARFRQSFKSNPGAVIQDAYYTIEVSYTSHDQTVQDPRLKDNYFGYGYLGTFDRRYKPFYLYKPDSVYGKKVLANYLTGYSETSVKFTPGGLNQDAENYAKQYFDLHSGSVSSFTQIQGEGGLVNGQAPSLVYSLWAAPGTIYSQYAKSRQEQYNLTASGTATISKKHTVKFGIEYEQNVQRSFVVGGDFGTSILGLWTLGRQLLNSHLTQLDTKNPILVYSNGSFTDTVNYNWQIANGAQSNFDKNFRNYLIGQGARDQYGRIIDQQTYINLDQYKPSDLKLSYFSPDELNQHGHSMVVANGYDYNGNQLNGKQSIADYLDPLKRAESAYNPIYTAGYIQDKFELKDIKFNIGLRVDRFDANQKVLVDPYSLFPIKTVGEVKSIGGVPVSTPGNIGSNYYVYVDDITNPSKITGYRNGSTWYNPDGSEQSDPKLIAQASRTGTITPLLEDNTQKVITVNSFKDYVPQINVMPRVSFSFPISDVAGFYANYNVLTIRPTNNIGAIDYYYYIDTRSTYTLPNPDLKPVTRTNYEIGFKQKISDDAFISINAYYGQIKDLVQIVKYNYAYPFTYNSYGNIDFGTVKGVTVGFNTRRTREHPYSGMTVTANYTLQFADGTGSGSTSAGNLVAAGFPNLRTTFPLDYDTRNQVNCILDYRFGAANDYVGPVSAKGKKILDEAGINLVLTAKSGNPYTAQSNVKPEVEIGVANRSALVGSINGENKPWQFKADLKIDKNFHFTSGKENKKELYVNVYLVVQNLLDQKNIVNIYRYTGLPNQDGYLQSAAGKSEASNSASQQAFIDQYNVKLNDPSNYVAPRYIRIGASVNF